MALFIAIVLLNVTDLTPKPKITMGNQASPQSCHMLNTFIPAGHHALYTLLYNYVGLIIIKDDI